MAKKYISKYTGPEIDSGLDNIPKLEGKLTELESELLSIKKKGNPDIKGTLIEGYYIQQSTGKTIYNADWMCTDYIQVNPGSLYGYLGIYAWYDADKNYISGGIDSEMIGAIAPANALYLRASMTKSEITNWAIALNNKRDYYVIPLSSVGENEPIAEEIITSEGVFVFADKLNNRKSVFVKVASDVVMESVVIFNWDTKKPILDITNGKWHLVEIPDNTSIQVYARSAVQGKIQLFVEKQEIISDSIEQLSASYNLKKIVVDQNGRVGTDCDFTDIQSALSSINDNSVVNRYLVYIKKGLYDISNVPYLSPKDYVDIMGESKTETIIYNHRDSYDQEVACFDPLNMGLNNVVISNLTLKIKGGKCCVHCDSASSIAVGGKLSIVGCRLIHEQETKNTFQQYRGGVNVGLHDGQTVLIDSCDGNVLAYGHTPINPTRIMNPSYFIVKNSNLLWIGYFDISSKNPHYFIAEGNKVEHIAIGISNDYANDKTKCNIILDVNNNITSRVELVGTEWFTKYPVCVNSIHSYVENNTSFLINKNRFVSPDFENNFHFDGANIFHDAYIKPYDATVGTCGFSLEDIPVGEQGVIQSKGKILLEQDFPLYSYIGIDVNGLPIVVDKPDAIGRIVQVDEIGSWMLFL